MVTKTIISGICKLTYGNRMSKVNDGYILNGDIEINSNGDEVYIEETANGEENTLIKNMPLIVQEYIKANKKVITC